MKLLAVSVVLLSLLSNQCLGEVLSEVDAPQDDLRVLGPCDTNACTHPELQVLSQKYNELLALRFFSLKQADVAAVFGSKLDTKPDDFVKPLFVPRMIAVSGLGYSDAANKRHVDYHAIGDIGYLEAHYGFNGESIETCVIYLRADAQFVPLKSSNDIPAREIWDNVKFEKLEGWLNEHMPRLIDLGEVEVATNQPTRMDLGAGTVCVIKTQDIHCARVPFWLSLDLAKETADQTERQKSMQYKSISRINEPVGFTMGGKFYRMVPKLVDVLRSTNK